MLEIYQSVFLNNQAMGIHTLLHGARELCLCPQNVFFSVQFCSKQKLQL